MNNMRKLMETAKQLNEMPDARGDEAGAREELYNLLDVIEELIERANLPESAVLKFMDFAEMLENISQSDSVSAFGDHPLEDEMPEESWADSPWPDEDE
jgi:hypothetical protein